MRYILGVSIYYKEKKTTVDGYGILNCIGMYPDVETVDEIKEMLDKGEDVKIIVYNTLEDIQKIISDYSVRFRRDDVWKPHQVWQKSKKSIRFYPIKLDSSKFEFKIGEHVPRKKQPIGLEKTNVYKLEKK